jgi:hypothetical protein
VGGAYTCRACGGTGKSQVAFDASTGFMGSGIGDLPVCAKCHGSGRVAERSGRERDLLDYVVIAVRWLGRRLRPR